MIARDSTNAEAWLLNLPPTWQQTRWAVAVAICQIAALALLAPFAGIRLAQINSFIPAVEGIIFVTDLLTSILLFSQFAVYRLGAILILACGYLFSALIVIPHALTFPGAFSPTGLLGAGLQTTGWLYWFWHLPFLFALLGYASTKDKTSEPCPPQVSSLAMIFSSVALVLALVCGLTLLATMGNDYLPVLFADRVRTVPSSDLIGAIGLLVCVCAFVVLWSRRRSLLDQWLVIVALAEVLEVGTAVVISPGRFDFGFYAGRVFSLLASTVVLAVLLTETTWRYVNLARSNEGKIRRLVDANIIGIIIGNLDGTITDSNDAFLQMLGYDRNDIARNGLNWMDMAPAEWRKVNEEHAAEIKATGIASTHETQLFRKDGSRVPVLCGAAIFDEARGQAVAFVVDLTERKRAEEALRRSEERAGAEERLRAASEVELSRAHRALIDAQRLSRTGSFIADLTANEHHWSEELYRIYELQPGTKIETDELRAMVHPEDRPSFESVLQLARTKGVGPDHHFRIVTQSGKVKHLHSVGSGVVSGDGRIEIVGALQDVTEQKAAEESLRVAQARLARAAELATAAELSASIAHEINQPLSGIVTNANTCIRMLGADPPNVDGARETARRTLRDGNRAAEVVTRLRALFNKKPPMLELIDLNEAGREVVALLANGIQANRVALRTEFAGDLPSVKGDRLQLQQVIVNLIQNAIDSMASVDDRIRQLCVATKRDEGNRVRLSVKDTGIGLAPDALERMFESFYTTKGNGMGIGLAISRSIIEGHEGRLWAETNDGPGVTFSFSIPISTEALI